MLRIAVLRLQVQPGSHSSVQASLTGKSEGEISHWRHSSLNSKGSKAAKAAHKADHKPSAGQRLRCRPNPSFKMPAPDPLLCPSLQRMLRSAAVCVMGSKKDLYSGLLTDWSPALLPQPSAWPSYAWGKVRGSVLKRVETRFQVLLLHSWVQGRGYRLFPASVAYRAVNV